MPYRKGYDAVVVGAGIVGLACAWRAAERGLSVLAVDRDARPANASGAAAGMLAPVTEAAFREEALLRLGLAGADAWPAFREELEARSGLPTGYRESGTLLVAAGRDDGEDLRRRLAFLESLGLQAEWLPGRDCRRLEPGLSPRVAGGILAPDECQVDPRATTAALEEALGRAGGQVVRGTRAEVRVAPGGGVEGVELAGHGGVEAEHVVVAAGADTGALGGLTPELRLPVRPVKGQVLRLRVGAGGAPPAERIIRGLRCYVVPRADGEVVVGATVEERGHDSRVTGAGVFGLLEAARELLPDVDELEWVEARAALRPGTPDNAPIVGAAEHPGLVWATGHYRAGVLLAPLTAEAVVAVLVGEAPPEAVAPFGPGRFAGPSAAGSAPVPGGLVDAELVGRAW